MIWWTALLPLFAGLGVWSTGGSRNRLAVVGVQAMLGSLLIAVFAESGSFSWSSDFALHAEFTPLSRAVAILVSMVAGATVAYASAHEAKGGLPRLTGLMLVFAGAMQLVVIADDLITVLIGWELMGACSWALIGHKWRQVEPMRSANFAFVVTRAGDLGMFLALFAVVAMTGSAEYEALGSLSGWPLIIATLGIVVAAASKAGQVPFSPWLFRAMDGPTSVSALLHSSTMVAAGAFLLARLHPWLGDAPGFAAATIGFGLTTAIAGGVVAAAHMHAKKLLAASTSAQLGLMFCAAGAGYPMIAVMHLITHALLKAPLFYAAGVAHERTGSFDLRSMWLGRALPIAAVLTAISALCLAGVPPLPGGWTKEEILKGLQKISPWLAAVGVVASGLSATYATRFAVMAFGPGEKTEAEKPAMPEVGARIFLTTCTILLIPIWWPAVHDPVANLLSGDLPHGPKLIIISSLTAVAIGIGSGLWLSRHPVERSWSDWLGLPWIFHAGVERPGLAVARLASRIDDLVFDGIPRGAAFAGRSVASGFGTADDHGIDGMSRGAGHGAVALLVRLGDAAARGASRAGEAAADLIPTGAGRVCGMAGTDARRMQTGMAHHYYALLAVGAAAGVLYLIFGA